MVLESIELTSGFPSFTFSNLRILRLKGDKDVVCEHASPLRREGVVQEICANRLGTRTYSSHFLARSIGRSKDHFGFHRVVHKVLRHLRTSPKVLNGRLKVRRRKDSQLCRRRQRQRNFRGLWVSWPEARRPTISRFRELASVGLPFPQRTWRKTSSTGT